MIDVFPGHRGTSRHGELELYDAPLGIRFEIEEAIKSEPILQATMEWEGAHISPLYIWQRDGRYHLLYDSEGGQCYAVRDDAYSWTRPVLNEVEFNGSSKNNLISNSCKRATGVFEDPSAPDKERFKAMGGRMYWWDPDSGEELSRRIKAEQEQEDCTGPRAEITGHMFAWTSSDCLHWTPVAEPLAYRPVNGGISARYDEHRGNYFAYIQLMGYPAELLEGIGVNRHAGPHHRLLAHRRLCQLARS